MATCTTTTLHLREYKDLIDSHFVIILITLLTIIIIARSFNSSSCKFGTKKLLHSIFLFFAEP